MLTTSSPSSCDLPGCGCALPQNGWFALACLPEKYCSRACMKKALAAVNARRKKVPEVLADDFGEVGVTRVYCDNPSCGRICAPLAWPSDDLKRKYCTNECRKQGEKMMDEGTLQVEEKPIVAGKPVEKSKKAPKAVKPKAEKPKAEKPAKAAKPKNAVKAKAPKVPKAAKPKVAKAKTNGRMGDDAVITVLKPHEFTEETASAKMFKLVKDQMTVGEFRKKLTSLPVEITKGRSILPVGVERGYIAIK